MISRSKKENRMSKEQPNPLEDMRRAINKINNQTTFGDTRIIVPARYEHKPQHGEGVPKGRALGAGNFTKVCV